MSNLDTKPLPLPSTHAPGTALDINASLPTILSPITIRGLRLQNRFVVSPMGMFSCKDGHLTDFHLVHYGSFAIRGAALIMIEATAVMANGRVTPHDSGLWKDSQIEPLRRIVDFIHSQGQKVAIQLFHSGRKASVKVPWTSPGGGFQPASPGDGGWPDDVWAPSSIPYSEERAVPRSLEEKDIKQVIQNFADAAKRAVIAGVDLIELLGAHGYLIHQFLSPLTNKRTDKYGGTFENRTRFPFELLEAVRAAIPDSMPLSLRISATEWMDWSGQESWTLNESLEFAKLLPNYGVDILDVSSGGNHKDQKIHIHPYYQVDLAGKIRQSLLQDGIHLLVAAVGLIDNPDMACGIVQEQSLGSKENHENTEADESNQETRKHLEPQADLVFVGRQFLRDPQFVLNTAERLGVRVQWPSQYLRARK